MSSGEQVEPIPRTLREQCERRAVRVGRPPRDAPAVPEAPVPMPPKAGAPGVDPAQRRLLALEAVDEIQRRLQSIPNDARLHHQLGLIYLRSLENPDAAVRHLCRAMLERPGEPLYRREVMAAWMQPGEEVSLELALMPGRRTLPWRDALAEARRLTGLDEPGRSAAFEQALRAQSILRASRLLPRRYVRRRIDDVSAFLTRWLAEGGEGPARIVISFPSKLRRRVEHLRHRERGGAPPEVWATVGQGPRWLLYGEGVQALGSVLAEASRRLSGVRIGITVLRGERLIYLIGRLNGVVLRMSAIAFKPSSKTVDELLRPPASPGSGRVTPRSP